MKSPTIDMTEIEVHSEDLQDQPVVDDGLSVGQSDVNPTADDVLCEEEVVAEMTCTKCETTESWEGGSWCPACGYYPLGNKYINLEAMGEPATEIQDDVAENLWQAIPRWACEVFSGVLVIAIVSLIITFFEEAGSPIRSWWAVIQAVLGFVLFLAIHLRVFFIATVHSERLSPLSWVTEPIKIWNPIFKDVSTYLWHIRLAAWGLAATFFAIVLVGGWNYDGLFKNDWGIRGYADTALVDAIKQKDKQAEKNLKNKVDMLANGELNKNNLFNRAPSRFNADCVVMGFTRNADGSFRELLLASMAGSKLQYVGRLPASDLTEEEQLKINAQLKKTPTQSKSIVNTEHNGTWLKPQMMLSVGYDNLSSKSQFKKIQFGSLLREEK